ncbi:MAG TPA: hypothetical protein VMD59_08855, partial [Acidimicrobiales bacterium]|nr:hypothetical protein [Acidimicrobiales bacterium]
MPEAVRIGRGPSEALPAGRGCPFAAPPADCAPVQPAGPKVFPPPPQPPPPPATIKRDANDVPPGHLAADTEQVRTSDAPPPELASDPPQGRRCGFRSTQFSGGGDPAAPPPPKVALPPYEPFWATSTYNRSPGVTRRNAR